jgi:DNA anti-recombination protein RmuC
MFLRLIVLSTAALHLYAQTSSPNNADPPWMLFIGLVIAFVAGGAVMWLAFRATRNNGDNVIEALRDSLSQVEEKLHQFEVARESSHASLREQLRQLAASELELQKETARLAGALRSPGVRGRWGEMQLRRVVELAGMSEHCDFEVQTSEKKCLGHEMFVNVPKE